MSCNVSPSLHAEIRIGAIGSYVPAPQESNIARTPAFGLAEGLSHTKKDVLTRGEKEPEEEMSDLCVKAFSDLVSHQGVTLSEIQLCCIVMQNRDLDIPHTAARLHQKLDLPPSCMTFDISQGYAGYTCGITIVNSLMEALGLDHALLFTCDAYSKIVHRGNRTAAVTFGDAAAVTYFCRSGAGYALVDESFDTAAGTVPGFASGSTLKMDGTAVLMNATYQVPASIRALLEKSGKTIDDVDLFLLHPGSKRIVDLIMEDLKLDSAKVPFEVGDYSNAITSSIPLMLKQQVSQKTRQRLLLSGFGVDSSCGSCLIELRD